MNRRTIGIITILAAATALSACEQAKSASALNTNLAGPIAGVDISAPVPMQPAPGARLRTGGPAIALVVQNATTTGVRPLTYAWEVASNAEFSDIVFAKAGVLPGGDGQTSIDVPVPLGAGRAYYWRSRAEDGANASPFSIARDFLVVDPPVLQAPEPRTPVGGGRVGSLTPTLQVDNAGRSGDVQSVRYRFEVSTSSSFGTVVASGVADEQPGTTSYALETGLDFDRTYHWRARAEEPTTTGPWSNAAVFLTPVTPSAGGGGGGGGGGTAGAPVPCSGAGSGVPNAAEGEALVACVKNALIARGVNLSGSCGAFEITTRVAWLLRDRGARLELYNGTSCNGHSHDIILFMPAGVSVDILVGAGGDNGPAWQVHHELIPGAPHVFPWNPDGGF